MSTPSFDILGLHSSFKFELFWQCNALIFFNLLVSNDLIWKVITNIVFSKDLEKTFVIQWLPVSHSSNPISILTTTLVRLQQLPVEAVSQLPCGWGCGTELLPEPVTGQEVLHRGKALSAVLGSTGVKVLLVQMKLPCSAASKLISRALARLTFTSCLYSSCAFDYSFGWFLPSW